TRNVNFNLADYPFNPFKRNTVQSGQHTLFSLFLDLKSAF
ncbi:unnamed protein product, partial [marine sediment metagenome]